MKIILFVIHELSLGGAQRVVVNLANAMDRQLYVIHLCLFKKKGELLDDLKKDIIIHDLNSSRVLNGLFNFSKLVFKLKPFVVFSSITHVNLSISILIPFFRLISIKSIFVSREPNNPSIRSTFLEKSAKLDYVYRRTISNFDIIIAQSNFMKKDLIRAYKLDSKKIIIVHNPLNFNSIKSKSNQLLNEEFIYEDKINIVTVGGLRYQKVHDLLLNLASLSNDNVHFHIIGSGPERKKLERLIQTKKIDDKVTLHGSKSNPYYFIKKSDLFILTSRYEGFPNVILEANACGKFVIAFKSPGVDEEIIKEGVNGTLVNFEDYEATLDKIYRFSKININKSDVFQTIQKFKSHHVAQTYTNIFLNYYKI